MDSWFKNIGVYVGGDNTHSWINTRINMDVCECVG